MNIAVAASVIGGVEYYRLLAPMMALRARGHTVTFVDRIIGKHDVADWRKEGIDADVGTFMGPSARPGHIEVVRKPDVIVLSRTCDPTWLETLPLLRARCGTSVLMDMDDDHVHADSTNPFFEEIKKALPTTMAFVRLADVVTVSTQVLADLYAPMRLDRDVHDPSRMTGIPNTLALRPTVVIDNALDDAHFARFERLITGRPKREGQIRIGWAGSSSHAGDLASVKDALNETLFKHPEARLVFIGFDARPMIAAAFYERCEFATGTWASLDRGLRYEDLLDPIPPKYYGLLDAAGFDVAIAPLASTAFAKARSALKLLEYGMLGLPTVASNFGPYRGSGLGADLAETKRDWTRALSQYIVSDQARQRDASAARYQVGRSGLISQRVDRWEAALRMLPNYTKPFAAMESMA